MAHPDPQRNGSEQGQRQHSGPTTEYSDAGEQNKAQNSRGGATPVAKDDPHDAPESGDKPESRTTGDSR